METMNKGEHKGEVVDPPLMDLGGWGQPSPPLPLIKLRFPILNY